MFTNIRKRDGRIVPYNIEKIANAIGKAMKAAGRNDQGESTRLAKLVEERLVQKYEGQTRILKVSGLR